MSLADQSQTWFPTSVQVTVHQARSLRVKGKNGTNDAYAIIQLAKDKFSTTVAEKCVAPVWKEEASFELPLFHPGNAERCTLYIIVMHRAQVGLDKFLGQAVVNLLDLHDHNTRKKTDWFKLVDKSKKEDKVRGEVLLDIVFMRNNMSASMFDLSMEDKPRSRISKLKDKVRGKKKDSFSDSASAIVPSVSHGLTDSEGEPDAQSLNQVPGEKKKKSKLKTLFAPKSNLQRNISQSMSTLGTLPEKNSSLSSSRSSGLNIDSPEVKKKFKFLGHKRSGSSDSKLSQGPFSLFGHKQSNSDANSVCVNGKHVYTEETEPKSGSTLSLNSSGSVEDIRKQAFDIPLPSIQIEDANEATLEQRRHQEDKERRQAEDRRLAEAKRLQEEEERSYREEEERKRRLLEEETRRKRQREEEAESRKEEEERRKLEAAENQRLEEERRQAEEKKRQEEASMSDRLTSLFGMIKKKEEKKEEVQPHTKEELPVPAPRSESRDPDPISHRSSNPFTSPLSSELPVGSNEVSQNQQNSSALLFLNRTAKVSAVKPSRLPQIPESEPADCHTPSLLSLSPATSEPTLSIVPSESPDTLSNLHSSSTPPNTSPSVSPRGSTENLSVGGSSPTMAEKKKRAPLPPSQQVHGSQNGRNPVPVREIRNPAYEEADASQQSKNISIPLPDYETLFPQKRHGVKGHTRWDHLIAEVHQRQRDRPPEFLGPEMSVDGPEDNEPIAMSSPQRESPNVGHYQAHPQETKAASSKKVAAPAPPKHSRSVTDSSHRQSQNIAHQSRTRSSQSAVPGPVNSDSLSVTRNGAKKVLPPTPASRPTSQMDWDTTLPDDHRRAQVAVNKEAPTAKPRQRVSDKELERQEETPVLSDKNMSGGNIQTLSISSMKSVDQKATQPKENLTELDPFPSTELLSKDPWAQPKQNPEADNLFTGRVPIEQELEYVGMTANDLDQIFTQEKLTDPFANFDSSDSSRPSEYRGKDEVSVPVSPTFQRKNSQRQKPALPSATRSDNKTSKSRQEPAYREETTTSSNLANRGLSAQTQADVKIPSKLYRGEDQFGADPFTVSSASSPSEPLHVVMEEPASQAGVKTPLRAWVSPTDVQPVSAQNSNGNGLALSARRPHPVKPMNTAESQQPNSTPGVKDIKGRDSTPGRIQVADPMGSGPYTQLTQEELITLVVKQQADLSRKDSKIVELEEYIDNLLVRVIDEKPAILQFLNAKAV